MFTENLFKVILKGMPDSRFTTILYAQRKVDKGVNILAEALPQPLAETTVTISLRIHSGYAMLTVPDRDETSPEERSFYRDMTPASLG